jgi:pyruvate,water dikinase
VFFLGALGDLVVGCTNATARLKTGDRVRVNGLRGTVEILARAE